MSDEAGAPCPKCESPAERLLSGGAGFLFKGDGFYITDNRSDAYKKKAEKDQSPGDSGSKKSDSKDAASAKGDSSDSKGSKKPGGEAKPSGSAGSSKAGGDD